MKRFFTLFPVFILMSLVICLTACGGNRYLVSDLGIIELSHSHVELGGTSSDAGERSAFTFTGENEEDYCVCTIKKGQFILADGSKTNEITLRSNETGKYNREWSRKDVDFISITVKKDEHIIGYAVIMLTYCAEIVADYSFPKVDGEYQDITQKQVDKILENERKLNKADYHENYYA